MSSVLWWQRGWSEARWVEWLRKDKIEQRQWMEAQKYTRRETSVEIVTEMGFWEHLGLGWGALGDTLEFADLGVKDIC